MRPTNHDDIIDSRDVIKAIEELDDLESSEIDDDEKAELIDLKDLASQGSKYAVDWQYGETLIRDSYFQEYAQELAEDTGMFTNSNQWPNYCIDWKQAARELQMDYSCIDFDELDYWIR